MQFNNESSLIYTKLCIKDDTLINIPTKSNKAGQAVKR